MTSSSSSSSSLPPLQLLSPSSCCSSSVSSGTSNGTGATTATNGTIYFRRKSSGVFSPRSVGSAKRRSLSASTISKVRAPNYEKAANDRFLQSTNNRRRYMRRGSKTSCMLRGGSFRVELPSLNLDDSTHSTTSNGTRNSASNISVLSSMTMNDFSSQHGGSSRSINNNGGNNGGSNRSINSTAIGGGSSRSINGASSSEIACFASPKSYENRRASMSKKISMQEYRTVLQNKEHQQQQQHQQQGGLLARTGSPFGMDSPVTLGCKNRKEATVSLLSSALALASIQGGNRSNQNQLMFGGLDDGDDYDGAIL